MSKSKKLKFQIEPNSLSEAEENSTRNVLRRLRNPSEAATDAEQEKPPLEFIKPQNKQESTGRPDVQTPGAQTSIGGVQTPTQLDVQTPQPSDVQTSSEEFYPSRKQRKRKTLRLPAHKCEKYELWCFVNKIDFQDAVEKAMDYLTGRPDAHVLIDDLDEEKENDEVLIFYQKWTGNKIKPKDRTNREEVKRFSDDTCRIGILMAILRAKSKINSFGYCVPVIEEVSELPVAPNYLDYLQRETVFFPF